MLSFFPRGVLDEILNLIEPVSEDFPSYSFIRAVAATFGALFLCQKTEFTYILLKSSVYLINKICEVYDGVFLCCPFSHEVSWMRS